ncbi:YaaL family protein [Tumebacillus sp. DT12]|uniref:YaaL family protein n=1 Tax=Tumebacillus lacus TaxID=2995335 RepID=A0ABT3X664_9BACL|nr:YaaL family protein [Tumebacillus lacus]MCX7571916.1 YaaL family protein [Tumebacillus lacus]
MATPNQKKWKQFADWLRGRQTVDRELTEEEKLKAEIDAAQKEWKIAREHINYVSDPELIDHAIFSLEAAERKYGYLLRQAKKRHAQKQAVELEKTVG